MLTMIWNSSIYLSCAVNKNRNHTNFGIIPPNILVRHLTFLLQLFRCCRRCCRSFVVVAIFSWSSPLQLRRCGPRYYSFPCCCCGRCSSAVVVAFTQFLQHFPCRCRCSFIAVVVVVAAFSLSSSSQLCPCCCSNNNK